MSYEEMLMLYGGQNSAEDMSGGFSGSKGDTIQSFNPNAFMLAPNTGFLEGMRSKTQFTLGNMGNMANQTNQQAAMAAQNLQAQQEALGQASMQQTMAEEQKKQQQRQQLLGLGLTLATGGFGGAGAAGARAGAGAASAMPIFNTTGRFF